MITMTTTSLSSQKELTVQCRLEQATRDDLVYSLKGERAFKRGLIYFIQSTEGHLECEQITPYLDDTTKKHLFALADAGLIFIPRRTQLDDANTEIKIINE